MIGRCLLKRQTPFPGGADSSTFLTRPHTTHREPAVEIGDFFTPSQEAVVARLYHRDKEKRRAGSTNPLQLKAVSPEVVHFLCFTSIYIQALTLVEFGTLHGYSAQHLATAAQRTGGRVFRLDKMPAKTAAARANLREAGLDQLVECHNGEGNVFVSALRRRVDFVLVDFGLPFFAPLLLRLVPLLPRGTFLFVDGWSKVEPWHSNPS